MTFLSDVMAIAVAPYAFRRAHEWRGFSVNRELRWPKVTLGWWTWDAMPEGMGERIADVVDVNAMAPRPSQPTLL